MMRKPHRSAARPAVPRGIALGLGALAMGLSLTACEGFSDALGLGKKAPDEFAVVRSAPLTLPPDFALRPPRPGESGPGEAPVREQARNALLSGSGDGATDGAAAGATTEGEAAFIEQAGASDVDPNIRHMVDREYSGYASEDESFVDSLIFWREEEPQGEVVDAAAEAERLRESIEAGEPITGDATPTIQRRDKALLEGVF